MNITEAEPTRDELVDQFCADIEAYHVALKAETGNENPDIDVKELFDWTEPKYHEELRSAIWIKTDGDWSVTPKIDDTGSDKLVLNYNPNKYHHL